MAEKRWPQDFDTRLSLVEGCVHLVQPGVNDDETDAAVIMSPTRAREVARAILVLLGSGDDASP